MKDEKTLDLWQSSFEKKLPKEKFDKLCNDSINDSELETSLSTDLLYFMNECEHYIESSCFDSLDKISIRRICSVVVYKSNVFEHINSKEHRDTEDYFLGKCMTYCERCHMEIKNDERREHIISSKHLSIGQEFYCDIYKKTYSFVINGEYSGERKRKHLGSDSHKENQ